jgi:tetratricopeptide (TPR) repeat protein
MSRWLAAIVVLAGVLAAGGIAFLNGGERLPIRLTPTRTVVLPLGSALAIAFALGAGLITLLALAAAASRAWRRWRATRAAARRRTALVRERVRAERLLVGGDAHGARSRLADAVGVHGEDERLLELLAGASEQSGHVAEAIAAVEQARTRLPRSPLLARRLAALYAAAGRWDDALAVEAEIIRALGASAAETARLRGVRFEAAAADPDPARGLGRLLALAREHPGFVAAWVAAGDRLHAAGRTARARHAYERGARVCPATVLLDRLAAIDVAAGRPERTTRTLQHLRRLHPADPSLLAALVRRHLREDALDAADAALAEWPPGAVIPALEALRGECCRRRGRFEQAAVHLARASTAWLEAVGFRCRACGAAAPSWAGRCAACGRWDTVASESEVPRDDPSGSLMPSPSGSVLADHCVKESPS